MSDVEAANKALIRAYHLRLWAEGDLSAIDEAWDPAATVSMTDHAGTALDAVKEDAARYWGAFADVATEIRDLLAEGDRVVLHWATAGTHVGPYGDVPATGRRVTMQGIDILTLRDGRITAVASMWDGLSVFEQMGVLRLDPQGVQPGAAA